MPRTFNASHPFIDINLPSYKMKDLESKFREIDQWFDDNYPEAQYYFIHHDVTFNGGNTLDHLCDIIRVFCEDRRILEIYESLHLLSQ